MEEREQILVRLWVKYNKFEVKPIDFVKKFEKLYRKECREEWNRDQGMVIKKK